MHGGYYGIYGSGTCTTTIDRASFYGNTWYGAYFATGATVRLTNSYFTDNNPAPGIATVGALVFNENVTATVAHSTFSNNRGDIASIQCTNSPNVTLTSLISFGNPSPGISPTCEGSPGTGYPGAPGTPWAPNGTVNKNSGSSPYAFGCATTGSPPITRFGPWIGLGLVAIIGASLVRRRRAGRSS